MLGVALSIPWIELSGLLLRLIRILVQSVLLRRSAATMTAAAAQVV